MRSHLTRTLTLMSSICMLVLTACGGNNATASGQHNLTIGLTYVPNIQFAPVYVADALGYYKDAGLNVTIRHHSFSEDEFGALVSGQEQVIYAGGDEVVQARSKGIAITYVASIYTQYPVELMVPAGSPIRSAADLRGRTIGIPGPYGATYIGLLSLLQNSGLTVKDVTIQYINYTQVPALVGGKVDAVMGYLNNESIQFGKLNFAIRTLPIFAQGQAAFISNGVAALQPELSGHGDDVKRMVAATLKGLAYVRDHPQDAVRLSQKYVPGLTDATQSANALAVLTASIPLWAGAGTPQDAATWQAMGQFLQTHGLIDKAVDTASCFTNAYLG